MIRASPPSINLGQWPYIDSRLLRTQGRHSSVTRNDYTLRGQVVGQYLYSLFRLASTDREAEAGHFQHVPLDIAKQQIRLVRIQPYRYWQKHTITCDVEIFEQSQAPAYQAVSYEWGPRYPNRWIEVNGKFLSVRGNLWDFLDILRKRRDTRGCYFWIDQICIDQTNAAERNHQVQIMGSIYSNAVTVLAWLGLRPEGIHDINLYIQTTNGCWDNMNHYPRKRCGSRYCVNHVSTERVEKHPNEQKLSDEVYAFVDRSYWTRLWIVQEIVLAEQIIFCTAHQRISKEDLLKFIMRLDQHDVRSGRNVSYIRELLTLDRSNSSTLWSVIARLYGRASVVSCSDPRDLLYGLLGLVSDCHTIQVDYMITSSELFDRLLEAMFSDMMSMP